VLVRRHVLAAVAALGLTATTLGTTLPAASASRSKAHSVVVAPASDAANSPSISKNGRYLAYQAGAISTPTAPSAPQIRLWDTTTRTTTVVSAANGVPFGGASYSPSISPDGRYIAYVTTAPQIVGASAAADTTAVVLWDRATKTTTVVAPPSEAAQYDVPHVSTGARFVTFNSGVTLVGDHADEEDHTFLWRRSTGVTRLVNKTSHAQTAFPAGISDSGRYLLLGVVNDYEGEGKTVLWDRRTDRVQHVASFDTFGELSGNGRYAAVNVWRMAHGTTIPSPAVWDRRTGKTTRLRLPARFKPLLHRGASVSAISDTGRYVTVTTEGRRPSRQQLLLIDRRTGKVTVASRIETGARAGNVTFSAVSKKATTIAFADNSGYAIGKPSPYGGQMWATLTHG
jgi:hypothetical protein